MPLDCFQLGTYADSYKLLQLRKLQTPLSASPCRMLAVRRSVKSFPWEIEAFFLLLL